MSPRSFPLQVVIKGTDRVSKVLTDIENRMQVFNRRAAARTVVPFRRVTRRFARVGTQALGIAEQAGVSEAIRRSLALTRALGGVARASGEVIGSLSRFALVAGTSAVGAATAMFALVRASAAAGDELAKTSRRLGLGAAQLQAWRYGAESSGVAVGTFDSAMQSLGRRVAEAAAGFGKGQAALAALGVAVRDGRGAIRPLAELLPDVADRLRAVESASARNALAARLFGDEGIVLVQMLEKGSAGLRQFEERARELGLVMGDQQAAASERFSDSLGDLGFALRGLRDAIAAVALPVLNRFTDRLQVLVVQYRPQIQAFAREFMEALPARLAAVRDGVRALWDRLEPMRELLDRLVERYGAVNVALGAVGALALATAAGPIAALAMSLGTALAAAVSLGASLGGVLVRGIMASGTAIQWLWAVVKNGTPLGRVLTVVGLLGTAVAALGVNWNELGKTIFGVLERTWDWISTWYRRVVGVFDAVGDFLGTAFGSSSAPERAGGSAAVDSRTARLASPRGGEQQRARVEVDFRNVPEGVDVRMAPGATADLDLRMGLALTGGV